MSKPLPTVEAYWSSPYSVDAWARLLTLRTDVEFLSVDSEDAIALGPVLPSTAEPRVAQAFALRDTGKSLISWTLNIRFPPDGPPPASVQETDTRLGGHDGLAQLLSEMAGDAAMCDYHIQTTLQASDWLCNVLPRSADASHADAAIHRLGGSARIEAIGYRFVDRDDGLQEVHITYNHKHERFFVHLLARARLTLIDNTWLPGTEDFVVATRSALFARKEHLT